MHPLVFPGVGSGVLNIKAGVYVGMRELCGGNYILGDWDNAGVMLNAWMRTGPYPG